QYVGLVALGAVIRGGTPHFEHVASECTKGLGQLAFQGEIPVGFGVLTCDTVEQAIDRAGVKAGNKGAEAALACLEMVNLHALLGSGEESCAAWAHGGPDVNGPSRPSTSSKSPRPRASMRPWPPRGLRTRRRAPLPPRHGASRRTWPRASATTWRRSTRSSRSTATTGAWTAWAASTATSCAWAS